MRVFADTTEFFIEHVLSTKIMLKKVKKRRLRLVSPYSGYVVQSTKGAVFSISRGGGIRTGEGGCETFWPPWKGARRKKIAT